LAGATGDRALLDYYSHVGPVWTGNIETALGDEEVNLAVNRDLIASSDTRVVVGLGATGLSCARYFSRMGLPFSVVDTRDEPPGLEIFQREFPAVPLFYGNIPADVIESASEVVVSPGVPLTDPVVVRAVESGAEVVGDIDLFVRDALAPVIGITGSNAKSTVTEWVGQMARDAGIRVAVGGNLGLPALDLLAADCELYVLELSSFQLERVSSLNLAVATVLNVSADHLDRHGTMPLYHRAKHRIFRGCSKAVVNRDDSLTTPLVADDVTILNWGMTEPDLGGFGLRSENGKEYLSRQFDLLLPAEELGLRGRHNIANALASLAIGFAAGFPMAIMLETLRQFRGLPHRCEWLVDIAGVAYVNDSKGTNTGATQAALEGLGADRNIVLIAGGQGKGADFKVLAPAIERHCKRVVLIGEAAQEMFESFSGRVDTVIASSMQNALKLAADVAVAGDTVLLSPACASFDMFSGYADRGLKFAAAVSALSGGAS
jgi:UDP-N-acetylmuramoylalanine--D-glutamate ligase